MGDAEFERGADAGVVVGIDGESTGVSGAGAAAVEGAKAPALEGSGAILDDGVDAGRDGGATPGSVENAEGATASGPAAGTCAGADSGSAACAGGAVSRRGPGPARVGGILGAGGNRVVGGSATAMAGGRSRRTLLSTGPTKTEDGLVMNLFEKFEKTEKAIELGGGAAVGSRADGFVDSWR